MSGQVVITGAAGGIGAAMAGHLLALGRQVAGIDIAAYPETLTGRPGFLGVAADITDPVAVEAAFDRIAARGKVAALVANAAVTDLAHHDALSLPYDVWARVLRVNVDGAFLTARAAARRMAHHPTGGNIVFVTSSLAFHGEAKVNDAPYCTSKAAVEMLARVMALELAPKGINVNTLFPRAIIDTGFFAHWTEDDRRRLLAPPGLLNPAITHVIGLAPGTATGRSLDQDRFDRDPAYRAEWHAA